MNIQTNRISAFLAVGKRFTLDIKVYLDEEEGSAPTCYKLQVDCDSMSDLMSEYKKLIPDFEPRLVAVGCRPSFIPRDERHYEYECEYYAAVAKFVGYLNTGKWFW